MLPLRDRAARVAAPALFGLTLALFLLCAWCSFRRHLHVDELSGLYAIQLGAAFGHAEYGTIELSSVLFRPLAWWLASSERLFVGFRWLELGLLLTLCWTIARVQRALPSALGRAGVFFGAVSFGPLWRHGFEVRHDIFVAFLIVLLAWATERALRSELTLWAASVTSFGVIIAQVSSSKAFTIGLPGLALCALLCARAPGARAKRFALGCLRFLPGIILGSALVAAIFGAAGMLGEYGRQLRAFSSYSSAPPYRLSALPLFTFAAQRAPVHVAFALIGLCGAALRVLTRKPLAEAFAPLSACALSSASLLVNPTPFPYNLTWLTPGWLLLSAFGFAESLALLSRARHGAALRAPLAAAVGALALLCFWQCEQDPYYRKKWDAQLRVVASAEALTSPSDPVLDLCGLVVSRPPVGKDWIVHSLYMPAYHAGKRETVRQIIERVWPPVAITVYRWSFLDRADRLAFQRNYLRFSDDVWLLGRVIGKNSDRFTIPRAGRYRVHANGAAGSLDGRGIGDDDVVWLARGAHATITQQGYTLTWAGPGSAGEPPPAASPLFEPGELPRQRDGR